MKFLATLAFVFCLSFSYKQNCKKLSNGTYKVELDTMYRKNYGSFDFIISDQICVLKRPTYTEQFNITWLPNCGFKLKNLFNVNPHDPTNKLSQLGEPWYDITKINQDTIYFTYRLNLHVQVYSGRFVKTE